MLGQASLHEIAISWMCSVQFVYLVTYKMVQINVTMVQNGANKYDNGPKLVQINVTMVQKWCR